MLRFNKLYKSIVYASLVIPAVASAQEQAGEIEEVVVTGSLIQGTPVDTALPVEVYTQDDLQLEGGPTALEFAQSLSVSGPTSGQSYYFGGGNTNEVSYNLRGIGSGKTLTLFNGRRVSENATIIPSIALQRTEILKDGAAVTYGADATGGVVNLITRDSFEGVEMSGSYKAIDGSDGDHSISFMTGFGGEDTNVLFAAEWDHRSELDPSEREFTSLPYSVNPAPWSTLTNLAGWLPRGSLPDSPGNTAESQYGSLTGGIISDFTQESCEAVGGIYENNLTCKYGYLPYYDTVSENEVFRLYGQVNAALTDTMDFNLNAAFTRLHTPESYGSPAQPVIRGPGRFTGVTNQLYVPAENPHVEAFAQRTGFADSPGFPVTQGYTPLTYRAFAHGGNHVTGDSPGTPSETDNKYLHVSAGLTGAFDNGIGYDFALTFNEIQSYGDSPDIIGYRLQEALSGFGGPSCSATDMNPERYGTQNSGAAGTGNCMWWNPFASNFDEQPVAGLQNPSHIEGGENPAELVNWVFGDRASEGHDWSYTADLVFNGDTPLELPGGILAWGAGVQWRMTESRESVPSDLYNGNTPCMWPPESGQVPVSPTDSRFTGCTPDGPGPFMFFGTNEPDSNDQEQQSVFGELSVPLLDTVDMTLAARHERFDEELDATVYKVSGKWQATSNIALRGSYGTNYQAPGAGISPGEVTRGVNSYTIASGNWRGATTVTQSGIEPETATTWNAGFVWQSQGLTPASNAQFIVDYFSIETEDELGLLASANDVADAVFSIPPEGDTVPTDGTALADCSHPLVGRVTFNGSCVQGETTADDFSAIRTDFGNGPGQTTAGYDFQVQYDLPVYEGNLRLGATATWIREFELGETSLDGFQIVPPEDQLGFLNFATIASATSELRANATANYSQGSHNVRATVNFISGVDDERFINDAGEMTGTAPGGFQQGTTEPFGPTSFGVFGDDWVTADLHYTVDLPWQTTFNASIHNVFDEAPPGSRQEFGYDPLIGDPLTRHFEIGFRKNFGGM